MWDQGDESEPEDQRIRALDRPRRSGELPYAARIVRRALLDLRGPGRASPTRRQVLAMVEEQNPAEVATYSASWVKVTVLRGLKYLERRGLVQAVAGRYVLRFEHELASALEWLAVDVETLAFLAEDFDVKTFSAALHGEKAPRHVLTSRIELLAGYSVLFDRFARVADLVGERVGIDSSSKRAGGRSAVRLGNRLGWGSRRRALSAMGQRVAEANLLSLEPIFR